MYFILLFLFKLFFCLSFCSYLITFNYASLPPFLAIQAKFYCCKHWVNLPLWICTCNLQFAIRIVRHCNGWWSVFDAFTYRTVNHKSVKPLLCMNNEPDKSGRHTKGRQCERDAKCIYAAITENQSESEHPRDSRPIKSKLATIIAACGAWPPTQ